MMRKGSRSSLNFRTSVHFIELSKYWNLCLLTLALLISIPPLNSLIHGTHVVMAHAMGSELAIDSYILFAVFAFVLGRVFPKREVQREIVDCAGIRSSAGFLNFSLVCLVLLLLVRGLAVGVTRYLGRREPVWLEEFPYVFAVLGFAVGVGLVRLVWSWVPLLLRPAHHKRWA